MKDLRPVWPSLRDRIFHEKSTLLLLDFDGTLSPLCRTPGEAALPWEVREMLTRLARLGFHRVAVLSGRSLGDLKSRFRLPGLFYVGNHGFEMEGPGLFLIPRARAARRVRAQIERLSKELNEAFQKFQGVFIENKVYGLSLHFRNVPSARLSFFRKKLLNVRRRLRGLPLLWREGKKVWEVVPREAWNKGDAALYLAKRFPEAFPIAVGDDETDEDMFRALCGRGMTIRVGRSKRSAAQYWLRSQKDVIRFLKELSSWKKSKNLLSSKRS